MKENIRVDEVIESVGEFRERSPKVSMDQTSTIQKTLMSNIYPKSLGNGGMGNISYKPNLSFIPNRCGTLVHYTLEIQQSPPQVCIIHITSLDPH